MKGYFLIVDLLGFSNIISNLSDDDLLIRINEWVDLTTNVCNTYQVEKLSLLSDTLFVGLDDTEEGLSKAISISRGLLNDGMQRSLPVRGAISFGEYHWGNLIYGKAVINAHKLEENQNWIGISCTQNLPRIDSFWGEEKLICYPTPLKSGTISVHPVVDWTIPEIEDIMRLITANGLTNAGELLSWMWLDKVEKTVSFSIYKSILKQTGHTYSKFSGFSPLQTIQMNIPLPKNY